MTIQTFTDGNTLTGPELNNAFNFIKTSGVGVDQNGGTVGTSSTTFTTVKTTDFTATGENKEVYNINWDMVVAMPSDPPAHRTGSFRLLITFDDATTTTKTIGSFTDNDTLYARYLGYYSGTKKIDTVEWQAKTSSSDTSVQFQGREATTSNANNVSRVSALYFTYIGDY